MKRMSVEERKRQAREIVASMYTAWVCKAGRWNADKVMDEVERTLRDTRRARHE